MELLKRLLAVLLVSLLGLASVACGDTAEGLRQDTEENVEEADQEVEEGDGGGEDG